MKTDSVFIIAEAGVNHNGEIGLARQLIDVAVQAGADAVKFQTFKAENVVSKHAPKAVYQQQTTDSAQSQLEMVKKLELSFDTFQKLKNYCDQKGILFLSTPFDEESIDFLDELGLPLFKIPSGEIINFPFLKRIASKKKPIIMSTGMSTLDEVGQAVAAIKNKGNSAITLLHCVSNYPAEPKDANLKAMQTMRSVFNLPVGFSDHTPGIEVALAAVALGACVIEKHFTIDRSLPGPDHRASLSPEELKTMVQGIRIVEKSLGTGIKKPVLSEKNTAEVARKSLVAAKDIFPGTILTRELIAIKRPGTGLPPSALETLLGRKVQKAVKADDLIQLDMLISDVS